MNARLTGVVMACIASPAIASAEPFFSISEHTLVARATGGPSWVDQGSGASGSVRFGALANRALLAGDVELHAATGDPAIVTALPSVGLKLKFLSTPKNMGYTYVYFGVRAAWVDGDSLAAPGLGIRDFITVDLVGKWAFALEWQALVSVPTRSGFDDLAFDGGVAIGVARSEETARNFAVLVGWKRDRVDAGTVAYHADGAFVTVAHQWR